jgi:hypothetical protein
MSEKSEKIQKASQNIKQKKIVLYHVVEPIDSQKLAQIKTDGYFNMSHNALGGQSNGYYFFTTHVGATHHVETNKDSWDFGDNKHAYIFECEIDSNTVKYPTWKLDYEAMQDFLFDMIVDAARDTKIKFDGTEVATTDDGKLTILENNKFSKISAFSPDRHSGLVEKIADFLYKRNQKFKDAYDKLLNKVFSGIGDNPELYAVKTTTKHKITNITQLDDTPQRVPAQQNSQIDKFFARYGKRR